MRVRDSVCIMYVNVKLYVISEDFFSLNTEELKVN